MGEVTLENHVEARIPDFTFPVHFGGCFNVSFLHEAVVKKVFGTALAEAAHEALHTAMPNKPSCLLAGDSRSNSSGALFGFSVLESIRKL